MFLKLIEMLHGNFHIKIKPNMEQMYAYTRIYVTFTVSSCHIYR